MTSKIEIRIGQIWQDNDSRMHGRQGTVVEISDSKQKALINWGRKTWVSYKRLRQPSQYRLVHDPKSPENLKAFEIECELGETVCGQEAYAGAFTLFVWAHSYEDAEKLFLEFAAEQKKSLVDENGEDYGYQVCAIEKKRGVRIVSGIMRNSS